MPERGDDESNDSREIEARQDDRDEPHEGRLLHNGKLQKKRGEHLARPRLSAEPKVLPAQALIETLDDGPTNRKPVDTGEQVEGERPEHYPCRIIRRIQWTPTHTM